MLLIIIKSLVLLLILSIFLGTLYEYFSRWQLEKKLFENKTFVEINGTPLHYVKKGNKAFCTVVFMSGMGSNHSIWKEVQDRVSKHATTISYDRNGILFSESSQQPITNENVSAELEQLLTKTDCPKPYILVGHSMAGIYLRPFISKHQSNIQGIVFAEAAHPRQLKNASKELLNTRFIPPSWFVKLVVNTGIYRTLFSFFPVSPEIPMSHRLHKEERDYFYRSYETLLKEAKNDMLNFENAEQYENFGKIPLTIILGTSDIRYKHIKKHAIKEEYRQLTTSLAHDFLNLSTNSKLVEAQESGHVLQVNNSELVAEEIISLLDRSDSQ
ncbi:alpha/beta fold hydrolase [Sphingobacterium sp. LRF_L2]|uniref:alpha/beta fold hydrolase n=1 Tax=Sphingobacterium sp. LRF_L2 TaxID=3369421 RepID=UPI003F603E59